MKIGIHGRVVGVLFLGAVLVALPLSAASAHDRISSTVPADGAVLTTPPTAVVFTFVTPPTPLGAFITARSASGEAVEVGPVKVDGLNVSATWPKDANSGTYLVSWRVVSGDGHPVNGAITFTVAAAGVSGASPDVPTTPAPTAPTAPVSTIVVLAVVALVVVAFAWLLINRRRHE